MTRPAAEPPWALAAQPSAKYNAATPTFDTVAAPTQTR